MVAVAESAADAVAGADVVVITTPWPQFKDIRPASFRRDGANVVVIDPWRLLSAVDLPPCATLVVLGRGPSNEPVGCADAAPAGEWREKQKS